MNGNWMIDVLGDLKVFARGNNMPRLAEQLEETILVALTETASTEQEAPLRVIERDGAVTRVIYREAGTGSNA